ncbi:hypothetical protein [Streptomyces sp. NPDC037389]|uniref:hypothetical protein n=1 Tax=Streptomyces sp. NPDC037389 TaxID=3155369 RepID=UPI0033FFD7AA
MQPYEEVTDVAYGERVAAAFAVRPARPGTMVLTGACPRCDHTMEFLITDQVVKRSHHVPAPAPAPAPAATVPEDEPMMCTCEAEHEHRPAGFVGCGAYWNIKVLPA